MGTRTTINIFNESYWYKLYIYVSHLKRNLFEEKCILLPHYATVPYKEEESEINIAMLDSRAGKKKAEIIVLSHYLP